VLYVVLLYLAATLLYIHRNYKNKEKSALFIRILSFLFFKQRNIPYLFEAEIPHFYLKIFWSTARWSPSQGNRFHIWIIPWKFSKDQHHSRKHLIRQGEVDRWKNKRSKISWHCPFKHSIPPKFSSRNPFLCSKDRWTRLLQVTSLPKPNPDCATLYLQ